MKHLDEFIEEQQRFDRINEILVEGIYGERRYKMLCEMAVLNSKKETTGIFPRSKWELWIMDNGEHMPPHIHIKYVGDPKNQFVCRFEINTCKTIYETSMSPNKVKENRTRYTVNEKNMDGIVTYDRLSDMLREWYKQPSLKYAGMSNYAAAVHEWNYTYGDEVGKCEYKKELDNLVCPSTLDALMELVYDEIERSGNGCNLNHIDTSKIQNMAGLFDGIDFVGDISKWDVSNVKNMSSMFKNCPFNGDISGWDVSKVQTADLMFMNSGFTGDLSNWNLVSLRSSYGMFDNCGISDEFKPDRIRH